MKRYKINMKPLEGLDKLGRELVKARSVAIVFVTKRLGANESKRLRTHKKHESDVLARNDS